MRRTCHFFLHTASSYLVSVQNMVFETGCICVCMFTENAEMMKEDFKQQPCMVDRLYGMH